MWEINVSFKKAAATFSKTSSETTCTLHNFVTISKIKPQNILPKFPAPHYSSQATFSTFLRFFAQFFLKGLCIYLLQIFEIFLIYIKSVFGSFQHLFGHCEKFGASRKLIGAREAFSKGKKMRFCCFDGDAQHHRKFRRRENTESVAPFCKLEKQGRRRVST